MEENVIVIPVKEHSQGVSHKNRLLIDRCLNEVLKTKYKVIVVGDDNDLLVNVKDKYKGLVTTYLLPKIGNYTDITDTLRQWRDETQYKGYIALVQCTSPRLKNVWIEQCFEKIDKAPIVATACELTFKPTALFRLSAGGVYVPYNAAMPAASVARQLLPHTIRITGAVEVFHSKYLDLDSFWKAGYIEPIIIDEEDSLDIDTEKDMKKFA